jgi:hypothetical protein
MTTSNCQIPPQMTNSWRALARMARDRIVQADPEDLSLVLNACIMPSYLLLFLIITNLSLSPALVPPSVLPRPSPPLQPSLSRSDQPLQRARQHLASLSAHPRPRARPPLRTRRHIRTRQVLGGRLTGIHRRAWGAPPPMQTSREDRPS